MIQKLFSFLLIFLFPVHVFAGITILSLLPNPAGDDALGEYIDIRNTGCQDVDIGGYELRDLQKGYVLPNPTLLTAKSDIRLTYATTKISLNNSGLETITLKTNTGVIVDTYSYSGTQRDNVILSISLTDDTCEPVQAESSPAHTPENTGTVLSGGIIPSETTPPLDMSGSTSSSGSVVPESSTGANALPIVSGESSSSGGTSEILPIEVILDSSGTTLTGSQTIPPESASGELVSSGTEVSIPEQVSQVGEAHSTGATLTETGLLLATELYYSDENTNGRIDTLEIVYPYVLTGGVNVGAIFLYLQTGGLYSHKINTETGYILSGSLSGNTLLLTLREGDIDKLELHITNSTTSDLRLKSSGDLGFHSLGGKIPEPFFLTSSFSEYENVIYKEYVYEEELFGSSAILPGTGSTSQFLFPELIPIIQSPTNAIFSSGNFLCTEDICRVNIDFSGIFSSGYSLRDFVCSFGTGGFLTVDSDCNPNTYYFTSSESITFELARKSNSGEVISRIFPVIFSLPTIQENIVLREKDSNPPIIILEHDGKWRSYYKQIGDNELECYAFTCAINFTAERSYDPEGGNLRFMWMYDMRDLSEKRDPGERKFGLGDHVIWLRVIDESENVSEIYYHIHVLGELLKVKKEKEEKKFASRTKTSSGNIDEKKSKKKKMKKLDFFDPPKLVFQSDSSQSKSYDGYKCHTTTETCSYNFMLEGPEKGITYTWKLSNGQEFTSKNPKSFSLPEGKYTLRVEASYDGNEPIWSEVHSLEVVEVKKPKKQTSKKAPKKSTQPKKIPPSKGDNDSLENELQDQKTLDILENSNEQKKQSLPYELAFFPIGMIGTYLIRRKFFL